MDLADLVDPAGQLEDTLGRRGFARIDVREYPNISIQIEICHGPGLLIMKRFAAG
jgi:hypothetical protein